MEEKLVLGAAFNLEVIYYWDYKEKSSYSTKNCNFNNRLPVFQGSNTLKKYFIIIIKVKAVYVCKYTFLPVYFEGTLYNRK